MTTRCRMWGSSGICSLLELALYRAAPSSGPSGHRLPAGEKGERQARCSIRLFRLIHPAEATAWAWMTKFEGGLAANARLLSRATLSSLIPVPVTGIQPPRVGAAKGLLVYKWWRGIPPGAPSSALRAPSPPRGEGKTGAYREPPSLQRGEGGPIGPDEGATGDTFPIGSNPSTPPSPTPPNLLSHHHFQHPKHFQHPCPNSRSARRRRSPSSPSPS